MKLNYRELLYVSFHAKETIQLQARKIHKISDILFHHRANNEQSGANSECEKTRNFDVLIMWYFTRLWFINFEALELILLKQLYRK